MQSKALFFRLRSVQQPPQRDAYTRRPNCFSNSFRVNFSTQGRPCGQNGGMPVPVLGTVAAGEPLMAVEHIERYLTVDPALAAGREHFALTVRGDSMINAGIFEGDTVILARTTTVQNGEIAAVWLEDAATVKRVYREKDRVRLQPENDRLEPIFTKDCTVLGKVIGLVRSYE